MPQPEQRLRLAPRALRRPTFDRLRLLLGGYEITQLLYVIAELRIADLLAEGSLTANELALETGTHAASLRRVLRGVTGLGVLTENEHGRFALTSLSQRLREDVPGSLLPLALSYGRRWRWDAWGHLIDSVRTGETAFEHAHGLALYPFLAEHRDAAADFNGHMALLAEEHGRAVASVYDFSKTRLLVDVGGGEGALVESILQTYDDVQAIVFDSPVAVLQAQRRLSEAGLAGRATFEAGDFFTSIPAGGDTYTLTNVVHDWDDEHAVAILRACRRAMTNTARLLVIQNLASTDSERSPVNVFDISLLVLSGGRERTLDEYKELLAAGGLSLERVVAPSSGPSILEARPR